MVRVGLYKRSLQSRTWVITLALTLVTGASWAAGCGDGGVNPEFRNDLESMETARIQIRQQTFEVWLATEPAQQERGLMQVRAEELTPIPPDAERGLPGGAEPGMLFVFDSEQLRSFWMSNTLIPLDIAYIRSDGRIVKTHTMAPLETRLYPSIEPAQFALEVRAGLFAELGIGVGDPVEIPDTVLKGTP